MDLLTKCMKIFLLQVFLHLNVIAGSQTINKRLKVRHGCKIKDENAMKDSTAKSLIKCVAQCTLETGCISISWNLDTSVCRLSTTDTIFESHGRGYEQKNGWTCATVIKYPVFNALKSTYGERYKLTFSQAADRCAELGTTLADRNDVAEAQNLGYSYCNCGWVSDGTNVIILDYRNGGCFWNFHQGPITCDFEHADAWCKMA